ncbi:uracil phosphoribosyltransferase [Aliifodinibius sp. S!AR15-10]|uniref:uracil phosphoribosyltransferase n=1 Tax=Aliifodinibius sp. S!AR15-10 TaxID=2950437 RepID=UPI0028584B95|nr:uracil phosphoribosyltransferase [Aliifodinibius sp. S!AR15-10]MDR8390408.1 uracil phosphoribosyltransferase [Aliifodinibius sp. S!AR15-10]
MENHKNVTLVEHPVVARDLTILRNQSVSITEFRAALKRISTILGYFALKDLPLRTLTVETPIEETEGYEIDTDVVVVPILRAGLGLVNGIVDFIPDAKVGHLGMYRDEDTHQPVDYYTNLPEGIEDAYLVLVDPMLATGGSANDALNYLKTQGAQQIHFISLISAPEGIAFLQKKHPDIQIITAAIDDRLNDDAFIVPGLGDAGDRYFGTI